MNIGNLIIFDEDCCCCKRLKHIITSAGKNLHDVVMFEKQPKLLHVLGAFVAYFYVEARLYSERMQVILSLLPVCLF